MDNFNPQQCSTWILLSPIPLNLRVGISTWERVAARKIWIRLKLKVELGAFRDALEDTVDYSKVASDIRDHFEGKSFDLIESIAKEGLGVALKHPRVSEVEIEVAKPYAMPECSAVSVRMCYRK